MITYEVFGIAIVFLIGSYVVVKAYLERYVRSLNAAETTFPLVAAKLEEIIDADVPPNVARVGFMLAATAGCGCYVRAVLLSHYLPSSLIRLMFGGRQDDHRAENDLQHLDDLTNEQRKMFSDLIASVIVYDGYRNPLSGWLFRRMMKSYGRPSFIERKEAELTTVSVAYRKKSSKLDEYREDLCVA